MRVDKNQLATRKGHPGIGLGGVITSSHYRYPRQILSLISRLSQLACLDSSWLVVALNLLAYNRGVRLLHIVNIF